VVYTWAVGQKVVGRSCLVAMAALAMLTLVGCGGASKSATGAGSHADPALNMSRCMRAHGVPNFPDPAAGGPLVIPNGLNANAPAFQSAQHTCDKLLPSGGGPGGKPSESARLAMVAIARCIRAHGVPNFPDPTTSPPGPGPGNVMGRGGMWLVIANQRAPAFERAAAACHLPTPR
jgi:hypothetical protein